jgi:hypothetical protein
MAEFFAGQAVELPLRDPMTMKPMDVPQRTDQK